MECLCPCYAWLKPWFCSITSTTPNTEEEEDDLEDEEENAIHDHQLEELQRRLDKEGIPLPAEDSDLTSINPASANSDKITVVVNDHHPISDQQPSKINIQFDILDSKKKTVILFQLNDYFITKVKYVYRLCIQVRLIFIIQFDIFNNGKASFLDSK